MEEIQFNTEVAVYRHLLSGGTVAHIDREAPTNTFIIRVVGEDFCRLLKDNSWQRYPFIVGRASSWAAYDAD